MSKQIKALIEQELKNRFEGVDELAIVSVRGIDGVSNNKFRQLLLEKNIRLTVVKNSMAGRAFESLGKGAVKEVLQGPCAVVYGGDSIVDVVKLLVEQARQLEQLEVKGGYLDGAVFDAAGAVELSKLPSRAELQGAIVMISKSPGARIAGAATGPGGHIAGCIKTLIENKEEDGGEAA